MNLVGKFYEVENHRQLYKDIGDIILKTHGILDSDTVNSDTKERFLNTLKGVIA